MTGELEKGHGGDTADTEEQEKLLVMEDVTLLDIDMLCSAVAMKGKWGKLINENDDEDEDYINDHNNDNHGGGGGGGVFRMWEGELVNDCLDDRRLALQSTCCPCYRFGKNMKRAGFGSCFLQGSMHLILAIIAVFSVVAFIITGRHCFLYLAIFFTFSIGVYLGYYRMQMRNKFNIKGGDSSLDDCVYHLICPCCTLSQESRTLEMNNVQDGIWHGRGDTICIGSYSEDATTYTKSPHFLSMQKNSNDTTSLGTTSVVEHSLPK